MANKGLDLRKIFQETPIYSFVESICTRKPFPTLFHFDPYGIDDTDIFNTIGINDIIKNENDSLQIEQINELRTKYRTKFKNKEFENINLTTYEFQATEFYKKCGFEIEFVRKNKENPKLNKYYLVKYF